MMSRAYNNPRWADPGHERVFLDTVVGGETQSFLWSADDPSPAGREVYTRALAGEFGAIAAYVAPVAPPATASQLRAYANAKADVLRATARAYTLTGGLRVMCDATQGTGTDLIGLKEWGGANPAATANFVQNDGGVVTLTGAQSVELANAVLAYGQSVFAALAAAMNGVANGAVTTTAQIDALAWPA